LVAALPARTGSSATEEKSDMSFQTSVRTFVTFEADFPDDSVWDAKENLMVPGGRVLATWLRERLQDRGLECSGVAQQRFYGWRFDATVRDEPVECILQGGHPWLLISEPKTSLLGRLVGHVDRSALEVVASSIHDILKRDLRFSSVRWFTRKDYEAGKDRLGADTPT
jgi:hypothetical protein